MRVFSTHRLAASALAVVAMTIGGQDALAETDATPEEIKMKEERCEQFDERWRVHFAETLAGTEKSERDAYQTLDYLRTKLDQILNAEPADVDKQLGVATELVKHTATSLAEKESNPNWSPSEIGAEREALERVTAIRDTWQEARTEQLIGSKLNATDNPISRLIASIEPRAVTLRQIVLTNYATLVEQAIGVRKCMKELTQLTGEPPPGPMAPLISESVAVNVSGHWTTTRGDMSFLQDRLALKGTFSNGDARIEAQVQEFTASGYWAGPALGKKCETYKLGSRNWGPIRFSFDQIGFDARWGSCDEEPTNEFSGSPK